MVWGLVSSRSHRALATFIGLAAASVLTPSLAIAKSQAGVAEVVYYDPMAMTPRAQLAAQTSGRSLLSNQFSAIEAYPDNRAPARPQSAAPLRITNLDQRDFVKIGAPYRQNGVWYVPANEPNYDETGTASWYGADFHGKETSNGEAFDMDVVSAAHPTLPLPCIVEVTNLANGRTLKVRVNDRGPFMKGRLIDLSRRGAQELGYYGKGSAKVRVRYVGPAEPDNSADDFAAKPFKPAGLQTISYRPAAPIRQAQLPAPSKSVEVLKPAAPVKPAASVAKASPITKQAGEGRYLQIGAFSTAANANKLRAKLGVAPVEIRPASDGTVYRVVMGPFADEMAMSQARATAADLGISNPRVVN